MGQPSDIAAIRKEITDFFKMLDDNGKRIGSHKWGIYAFYDYDGEPIYVGQTCEGVSSRIGRHLTNQRTDAVAMNVLDPFEVADIRVWPLDLSHLGDADMRQYLHPKNWSGKLGSGWKQGIKKESWAVSDVSCPF